MRENPNRRSARSTGARIGALTIMALAAASLTMIGLRGVLEARPGKTTNRPIHVTDNFERGLLDAWQLPYPEDWAILEENRSHYLHMKRSREPGVPRRPLQYAMLKEVRVGSFDLKARVRRAGGSMIIVFNYVDTLHFYYTHLSVDPGSKEPVHNGIFLVNNGPRVRIAGAEAVPALPDTSWHQIKVVRDVASGRIEVSSDVQRQPRFTIVDRTFTCGQIGIGSFDETGDFDDVDLRSDDSACDSHSAAVR